MENPPPAPVRPQNEPGLKSLEREPTSSHFRALHGRILLGGDTLNPDNKSISPVTKETLANGSPQILNECATNCRRREATVGKDQLEEEVSSRVANNTLVLKQDLSKIKDFDPEKATRWQATLTKLFGKDTASATEAEIRTLFDKYFYSKDKLGNKSDTDLFAEDVLKAFEGDTEAIEKNADCIIWYARICGFTQDYSEMVFKHQITAKALLKNKPDQLVEELNQKQAEDQPSRINATNGDEDQVLRFIWGNRGKLETPPTKTEPPEPKPDETKPTPETEDETAKKQYLKKKGQAIQIIDDKRLTLEQLNQYLEALGAETITGDKFKQIKEDENEKNQMARNLAVAGERWTLKNVLLRKTADDEIKKLSGEQQLAIRLNNLAELTKTLNDGKGSKEAEENLAIFLKEHGIDIQKLLDSVDEAVKAKEPSIDEEVNRRIKELEKNIDNWEGVVPVDEPAERKPIEAKKDETLEHIFNNISGEVNDKHRFFVEDPPVQINLTDEQMDRLNLVEPFFVDIKVEGWSVNKKVVPFVFELGDVAPHPDKRFINGEAATKGDSGLVGLAAASASTPEQQARLYKTLANAVVDIHLRSFANTGRPALIDRWYAAQQKKGRWDDDRILDSLGGFEYFDHDQVTGEVTGELRPENERLFMYKDTGELDSLDIGFWMSRTKELHKALETGTLQPHHLRWIELLAHSVDVNGLIKIIKESSPATKVPKILQGLKEEIDRRRKIELTQ